MRALGPGSVSSFLKIILDVFYYILLVALGGLLILSIAGLLLSFNPEFLAKLSVSTGAGEIVAKGPVFAAGLIYADLYLACLLAIIGQLRRVFATLTAGDPFHPENIRRLRLIGFVLAGMEVARHIFAMPWPAGRRVRAGQRRPQRHRLVRRPGGLRAGGGVPRGRPPAQRSRTDDLGREHDHGHSLHPRPHAAGTAHVADRAGRPRRRDHRQPVDPQNRQGPGLRFSTLDALCRELQCQPGDIVIFEPGPGMELEDDEDGYGGPSGHVPSVHVPGA